MDVGGVFSQEEIETLFYYIYNLKCFPGGRSLWQLGTPVIQRVGADSLQNCWHVAVNDPIEPFCFAFNELMLGGGVGFNVLPEHVYSLSEVKYDVDVIRTEDNDCDFIVPDNREGWVELLKKILSAFFFTGRSLYYSTSAIRARGKPIKTFGGTASGSEDLVTGLENIVRVIKSRVGNKLRPIDCLDIMNIIGSIVVAGNVRRSAEIALGDPLDPLFIDAKNWNKHAVPDWRQMSNNSIVCNDISSLPENFWSNFNGEGEPCGLFNLNNARRYGRVADGEGYRPDLRVVGMNPCCRGNTAITTRNGEVEAKDLVGKRVEVLTDHGFHWTDGFFSTGVQELIRVETETRILEATPHHRIKCAGDIWKTVGQLSFADRPLIVYEDGVAYPELITDIRRLGFEEVFDCQIPGPNNYVSNGFISHNCGEITLESYENCVSGDTRIQTDLGCPKIKDVVGHEVNVWNGSRWSKVVPKVTGKGQDLYRVTLSDGSYLDCTDYHGWEVKPLKKGTYRRVSTKELEVGSKVLNFALGPISEIVDEPYAYEWGLFTGDGYLDNGRPMVSMQAQKIDIETKGIRYKEQRDPVYGTRMQRISMVGLLDFELAKDINDKSLGIPDYFFGMSRMSILEFVAGYIDTDGSIGNAGGEHMHHRIYGGYAKLSDTQLLLRRAGINHSTLNLFAKAGSVTNFGKRTYDLWYITIPSFECKDIPTRLKVIKKFGSQYITNGAHPSSAISHAARQKVVSIEKLPGKHTTYCFDEPLKHMGVFNNTITHQCNLVDLVLPNLDNINEFAIAAELMFKVAKCITMIPSNHPLTQEVVSRNRRIGVGVTGVLQALHFYESHIFETIYRHIEETDRKYSKLLKINESIKLTTVKPSGTLSLLPGVSPGVHPAFSDYYIRRVRFASDDPLVDVCKRAGYPVEPRITLDGGHDMKTMVVEFPIKTPDGTVLADEISAVEQLEYASFMQRYWADNSVSVTVYYSEDELPDIRSWLNKNYNDSVKSLSFLLRSGHGFKQAPLEAIDSAEYAKRLRDPITKVDDKKVIDLADGLECANGFCPVK